MHTITFPQSFSLDSLRRSAAIALTSMVALSAVACGGDAQEVPPPTTEAPPTTSDDETERPSDDDDNSRDDEQSPHDDAPGNASPPGALCGALFELVQSGDTVSECEEILAEDCDRIIGTLNDAYVDAVEQCIDDGGDVVGCMIDSVEAFDKTPAHEDLAATFCDECAFGVPGCEHVFYIDGSEWGLGTLLLPFSAEVLDDVRDTCADGFTCAVDFPSCAMDVLQARLSVDASRECLMDEIL